METEQTPSEIAVAIALLDLALLQSYTALRLRAPSAVATLKAHNFSVRGIARLTGIPRTTLHRWTETGA